MEAINNSAHDDAFTIVSCGGLVTQYYFVSMDQIYYGVLRYGGLS